MNTVTLSYRKQDKRGLIFASCANSDLLKGTWLQQYKAAWVQCHPHFLLRPRDAMLTPCCVQVNTCRSCRYLRAMWTWHSEPRFQGGGTESRILKVSFQPTLFCHSMTYGSVFFPVSQHCIYSSPHPACNTYTGWITVSYHLHCRNWTNSWRSNCWILLKVFKRYTSTEIHCGLQVFLTYKSVKLILNKNEHSKPNGVCLIVCFPLGMSEHLHDGCYRWLDWMILVLFSNLNDLMIPQGWESCSAPFGIQNPIQLPAQLAGNLQQRIWMGDSQYTASVGASQAPWNTAGCVSSQERHLHESNHFIL